jgi:Ca2+-transporting ATPase
VSGSQEPREPPKATPLFPHARSAVDLAAELSTDLERGLVSAQAAERLVEVGPNRIESKPGPTRWDLLVRQFRDVLVLVLIVAALVSGFLLGDWVEAIVIVAIVAINAAIGYVQEAKAADAAEGLRKLSSPSASVIRDGSERRVPTAEIVPGDLIVIESGDRMFADARLVSASRLEVDESELTGESTAVSKAVDSVDPDAGIGDRTSMVFAGTIAVAGRGTAVVTSTGLATEIGHIAGLLAVEEPPTPLERELAHVGRRLGVLAGLVAGVVFAVGLLQGRPVESMFLLAVALAVAAIPEGLPAVVGVTLGLGVQQMAKLNAIVRRLPAVEALGAVTVICTDKTGTLTRNEIRVQEVLVDGRKVDADAEMEGDPRFTTLARLAILCNDGRATDDGWRGDPTEIALLLFASEFSDLDDARRMYPRLDELPFASARKRMTTLHTVEAGYLVAVKGAPEVVVPGCARVESGDGVIDLEADNAARILESAEEMAGRGLRTLALAYRDLESRPDDLTSVDEGLVFVALVGMSDQLREEARRSVDEAMGAGVIVVMITGDHEVTARSIARGLGLADHRDIVGGRALHSMSDDALVERVEHIGVYARVDPADKMRIVRAWQANGEIVAMTGDGVNDAPALRIADIGVAMGSGTDVARDASDMVLADDNFATIVAAVRSGRTIFSNIRRVIAFLLAANVSEIIVVFVGFLLLSSWGEPLLASQILWVNLVTDGLPAVALGFDPPDHLVMRRPPVGRRSLLDRRSQIDVLIRGVVLAGVVLLAFGYGTGTDMDWELTRTLGFTTLVLVQLTYIYALRVSESGWRDGLSRNPVLHWAVALSVFLQVLVVATPLGNRFFSTTPLSAELWLISIGLSLLAFLAIVALSSVMRGLRGGLAASPRAGDVA